MLISVLFSIFYVFFSDEIGRTPLYNVVTQDGKVELVKYLLAHNASVNMIERREMRPMLSVRYKCVKTDVKKYALIFSPIFDSSYVLGCGRDFKLTV